MRFDWYAATVPTSEDEVLGELVGIFDLASVRASRPRHGYLNSAEVHRGDQTLAQVLWGGNPGVHIIGTGENAPAVAECVRECWPRHRVTRLDVAEDYTAPEAWDSLTGLCLGLADQHHLKVTHLGDFHRQEDGRTIYIGAASSVARIRVYEKGRQLGADPEWVRVELVARPSRAEAREYMAKLKPPECWGVTSWCAELAERLGADDVLRFKAGTLYGPSDMARAREHLLHQYGRILSSWAEEVGGWGALGRTLGEAIERSPR